MKNRTVALKKGWFVRHSPKQTVHNMLDAADLEYLKSVTPSQLEEVIFSEVQFIAPFDDIERRELKEYVHQNIDELRAYILILASRRNQQKLAHR